MEIEELRFTKSWTSKTDFPTVETDETKVREDLQLLHDETRDFINDEILPVLNGETPIEKLPVTGEVTEDENSIPTSAAVKEAIENAISGSGNVPPGGNENDFLMKRSGTDYDFGWADAGAIMRSKFDSFMQDYIPVGTVVRTAVPLSGESFALCNGDKIVPSEYPELWSSIVPDYGNPHMEKKEERSASVFPIKGITGIDGKVYVYGGDENGGIIYNVLVSDDAGDTFEEQTVNSNTFVVYGIRKREITNGNPELWYIGYDNNSPQSVKAGKIGSSSFQLFQQNNAEITKCDYAYYGGKHWFLVGYRYASGISSYEYSYRLLSYDGTNVVVERSGSSGYRNFVSGLSVSEDESYIGFLWMRKDDDTGEYDLTLCTYASGGTWQTHTLDTRNGDYSIIGDFAVHFTEGTYTAPNYVYLYGTDYYSGSTYYRTIYITGSRNHVAVNRKVISGMDYATFSVKDFYADKVNHRMYFCCKNDGDTYVASFGFPDETISGYSESQCSFSLSLFDFGDFPTGIISGGGKNEIYVTQKTVPMLSGTGQYFYIKAE